MVISHLCDSFFYLLILHVVLKGKILDSFATATIYLSISR